MAQIGIKELKATASSGQAGDERPEALADLLAERLGRRIDLALSFQPVFRGMSSTDEPA